MIKLFRKIRKNLLLEGKTTQYFKYAIGEIILVVIGILIALQINNWNENRQKKNFEIDYLTEIKGNLEKDTLNINDAIVFNEKKIDSIVSTFKLFEVANNGEPYFDKFRLKVGVLTDHVLFEPVRTGFDNMVSSEKIGLISNKDLRTYLSNYYSDYSYRNGTQERVKLLTRKFTDEILPIIMSKEMILSFFGMELNLKSTSQIAIHTNEKVAANLFLMLQTHSVLINELKERKIVIKNIIHQIDKELNTIQ